MSRPSPDIGVSADSDRQSSPLRIRARVRVATVRNWSRRRGHVRGSLRRAFRRS